MAEHQDGRHAKEAQLDHQSINERRKRKQESVQASEAQ